MSNKLLTILQFTVILNYDSKRPLSDILTEIRAIKGVTIVNIKEKSRKMFDNKFFNVSEMEQNDYYRTILLIKIEISHLNNINVKYFLYKKIMEINSVKNCIMEIGNKYNEP